MTTSTESASGRESARDVAVWDPLVRFIHWSVALSIVANGFLTDAESDLHEWLGYMALGLVTLRLLWALIGPRNARFAAFPPSPVRAIRHLRSLFDGERTVHLSHNPLGALMVYNIWATIVAIAVSGYMMTTIRFFGVSWVETFHELAFDWIMISVGLHVAGVAFDSWRSGVNLAGAMISGTKRIPRGTRME